MISVLKIRNLGCANCAAKMERKIAVLPGVSEARVNFLTQKLTLNVSEEHLEDALIKADAIIKAIEPQACLIRRSGGENDTQQA